MTEVMQNSWLMELSNQEVKLPDNQRLLKTIRQLFERQRARAPLELAVNAFYGSIWTHAGAL